MNWGPWDKTGKGQFASRGIQVIPAPAGVAAAARELLTDVAPQPVVVFGGGPWVAEAVPAETAGVGA